MFLAYGRAARNSGSTGLFCVHTEVRLVADLSRTQLLTMLWLSAIVNLLSERTLILKIVTDTHKK
jgi:hypothetical protein